MTTHPAPKRPRGRPKGSGMKADSRHLRALAIIRIVEPQLTLKAAISRYLRENPEPGTLDATLRRHLQARWRGQGAAVMAAVQAERARPAARREPLIGSLYPGFSHRAVADMFARRAAAAAYLEKLGGLTKAAAMIERALETRRKIDKALDIAATLNRVTAVQQAVQRAIRPYGI